MAAEKLENEFKKVTLVDQIWVYGDSEKAALVAIVVPDAGALSAWAHTQPDLSTELAVRCLYACCPSCGAAPVCVIRCCLMTWLQS